MAAEPLDIEWWSGKVQLASAPLAALPTISAKLQQTQSGSAAFQAVLMDGRIVWAKAPGNPQGDQVLTTEFVISSIGQLLGVSLASPIIARLPSFLSDAVKDHPQVPLFKPGPVFASLHIEDGQELYSFKSNRRDNNPKRHVGIWALWDLFLGADPQWIYCMSDDAATYSFDHSLWLDRQEDDWDAAFLIRNVGTEWETITERTDYFDKEETARLAQSLYDLRAEQILEVFIQVPLEWGTSTTDLEALGWFLMNRRLHVAERLNALGK